MHKMEFQINFATTVAKCVDITIYNHLFSGFLPVNTKLIKNMRNKLTTTYSIALN